MCLLRRQAGGGGGRTWGHEWKNVDTRGGLVLKYRIPKNYYKQCCKSQCTLKKNYKIKSIKRLKEMGGRSVND